MSDTQNTYECAIQLVITADSPKEAAEQYPAELAEVLKTCTGKVVEVDVMPYESNGEYLSSQDISYHCVKLPATRVWPKIIDFLNLTKSNQQ